MGKRLEKFPDDKAPQAQRRYPWDEWADGSPWEIRRGDDYPIATENMRVNLHMKADQLGGRVRTKKVTDEEGEGLVFQFLPSEEEELVKMSKEKDEQETREALNRLYADADEIYERAREEVYIERSDGSMQKYAAVRFKQQIDKARDEGMIVPTVARIVRKATAGFSHLEKAGRADLMLENLVIDPAKPYHHLFSEKTVEVAEKRMADLAHG